MACIWKERKRIRNLREGEMSYIANRKRDGKRENRNRRKKMKLMGKERKQVEKEKWGREECRIWEMESEKKKKKRIMEKLHKLKKYK